MMPSDRDPIGQTGEKPSAVVRMLFPISQALHDELVRRGWTPPGMKPGQTFDDKVTR